MSNEMPIYSHIVPKSQYRNKNTKMSSKERPTNLARTDFDPLNYNNGGQFLTNDQQQKADRREQRRSKEESSRIRRSQSKNEPNEGKVEAYLRQNQVSIRQQQHRHSAVRQAEHKVNLRSLPLNELPSSRGHDRTPTDRQRGFPEREKDREHRREKDRDKDDFDASPQSPKNEAKVRKSSSAHKMPELTKSTDKRRFLCREWAFQKIAHCLEQRPGGKTAGTLILGDAGSGKTALCQELSEPGQGPQARQQRALNRRMLARHFLQSNQESSLRPGELIRSLAMQILSQSSRHAKSTLRNDTMEQMKSPMDRPNSDQDNLMQKFKDLEDDGEESSKPLLGDSEDQRTDEEEGARTMDRRERERCLDSIISDAVLSRGDELPEIMPRTSLKPTNPFLTNEEVKENEGKIYENHENVFLRNLSRQSKDSRSPKLVRQTSEPLSEKKIGIQKSMSEQKQDSENERSKTDSPPKSRIPIANFRYPNKSELKTSSVESSPQKSKPEKDKIEDELPEYTNLMQNDENLSVEAKIRTELEILLEKKRSESEDGPPPIPSLPVNPKTLIANAYYEKLLSDPEIQQALLPQNLEKNPDECFKKALLFPLLEIDPPKQCLFILVDAIDEGNALDDRTDSSTPSKSVATLLARQRHLLPQWLLLVCTARKHCKRLNKMFSGFRKITLDELLRPHVSSDVQRYVLARLDSEPRLRARVSSDSTAAAAAAAALDHLRIKSDGCLLYLEKVLDGVAEGFITLREIKEIPGTLNGLYLWLAQRLFHGRRFAKVRLLLDVLLAAKCGVTEDMLYKCLLTKEYSVTREDFNRRLHLLRRILVQDARTKYLSLFHASFARWLLDMKHCTRRYLCSTLEGHAALAMYYTLEAKRLSALEVHNYVLHMTNVEQYLATQKKKNSELYPCDLDVHTLVLLWVLDSGCDVDAALKRDGKFDPIIPQFSDIKTDDIEVEPESETRELSSDRSPLESLMPSLSLDSSPRWPREARVMQALLELSRGDCVSDQEVLKELRMDNQTDVEDETKVEELVEEPIDPESIFELATRGDDEGLAQLVKLISLHPSSVLVHDAAGSTPLHVSSRAGRVHVVRALLTAGASVDTRDGDQWSALRAAAWAGHDSVVDVLLEFGCEVDSVDADNRTALRAAAWSGHSAVVHRLLAAGASPHLADAEGRTPLIAAAYMGHADIVGALLDGGARPDHADLDGRTALAVAALSARGADCVSILTERGCDVTKADRDGATPLLVAAFEGHTDICEILLEAEADIEAADSWGRTPLWAAAGAGHVDTVRLLLFWGASVDTMDREGRTVLSTAAAHGNVEVVRQLLDRGLDENHRDNSGWTPLHYAAFEGHLEVSLTLLEAGARADEADNDGQGALCLAAREGHASVVGALLARGADLRQAAHDGKGPLRLAALEGHIETVQVLYSHGADVDALDADRRSTLYVLALDNRLEMARYLITECGADVDSRDAEGRTPLHVSAWQGHTEMVNLLVKVGGARVEARDRCGRTALHAAAWRGRGACLRALLELGGSAAAVCGQGATPLGIAAQEGHEECVLWLLQHGADPLQADHCGRTPATVAWRAGHANISRLLERCSQPSAPALDQDPGSPDVKRRSVHSCNSTKSSATGSSRHDRHDKHDTHERHDKPSRANLSLSFAQQVARCGRRRDRERETVIHENSVLEKDDKLRSYAANEKDADIRGYVSERDRRAMYNVCERDNNTSPLYASPPRSPVSDICSPSTQGPPLPSLPQQPTVTDQHFNRDTHMRIILGRESKPPPERNESRSRNTYNRLMGTLGRARGRIFKKSKSKRNGIATNPAMRLVANVKNGLDSAAANIRRTGVALAASASSANPAVKTDAFQWRKETPL